MARNPKNKKSKQDGMADQRVEDKIPKKTLANKETNNDMPPKNHNITSEGQQKGHGGKITSEGNDARHNITSEGQQKGHGGKITSEGNDARIPSVGQKDKMHVVAVDGEQQSEAGGNIHKEIPTEEKLKMRKRRKGSNERRKKAKMMGRREGRQRKMSKGKRRQIKMESEDVSVCTLLPDVAEAANKAGGMTEEGVEREEGEASVAIGEEEEGMTEDGGERGESETWPATGEEEEVGMTEEGVEQEGVERGASEAMAIVNALFVEEVVAGPLSGAVDRVLKEAMVEASRLLFTTFIIET
uniref:Uncharacterized protein n=1 Tax=Globodera rostochiensis TaxID=31243 RepID=A0A914H177_GLORO